MNRAGWTDLRRDARRCGWWAGAGVLAGAMLAGSAHAATAVLPSRDRSPAIPLVTDADRAAPAAIVVAAYNSDADDGAGLADPQRVTFGRALDLQGIPLFAPRPGRRGITASLFGGGLYQGPFVRPNGLPVRATSISSGFGTRWHPLLGGYRFHAGVDLVAPAGAPIFATSPGMVSGAGWCGGYGLCVTVDHGDGLYTLYGHLSRVDVATGQQVANGQSLGLVGSTGQSTGPHLHYEVRVNGHPVDPHPFLRR